MHSVGKWKGAWGRLIQYVKSHIWVALTGSMILLFLGLAIIFQNYLKNEYFNYLVVPLRAALRPGGEVQRLG